MESAGPHIYAEGFRGLTHCLPGVGGKLPNSSKIAQPRIAYGGRDQITDVQQPRYGQQFMDVVLPF